MIDEIGMLAGKVWECLHDDGRVTVKQLTKKVHAPESEVLMAIGWLAREDKLVFTVKGRVQYVGLTEDEKCLV